MVTQLLLNSLIAGSVYALVGAGFYLIFRSAKFFDFTYGFIYSLGPYTLFALYEWFGVPTTLAVISALMFTALLGFALDVAIFAQLRDRGTSSLVLLLTSIGAYVVGQNVLSIAFGDGTRSIRSPLVAPGIELLGSYHLTTNCHHGFCGRNHRGFDDLALKDTNGNAD